MRNREQEPAVENRPPLTWFKGTGTIDGGIDNVWMSSGFRELFPKYEGLDPVELYAYYPYFAKDLPEFDRERRILEAVVLNKTGFNMSRIMDTRRNLLDRWRGHKIATIKTELAGYLNLDFTSGS